MNLPSLSIIIPNLNHGEHLPRAVNAILRQPAQPFEIIIIDDGSTDRSVEVIEGLARQHAVVKFRRNDQNRGVCFTANRGLDLACGDYVFFSAADDEILPGFLEKSLGLLARYPEAGLSCTIGDWRERHTGIHWHMGVGMTKQPAYLSPEAVVRLEQQGRFFIPGHTAIYRRDALIRAGKLVEALRHFTDWFATTVLALRHGVCVVPEALAVFNIDANTYYQRNRRNRAVNEAAITHALQLLTTPAFADVAGLLAQSGGLYVLGPGALRVLVRHREYRRFLTPRYVRKMLWHATRVALKRRAPAFLVNWYAGLAGYRMKPEKTHGE